LDSAGRSKGIFPGWRILGKKCQVEPIPGGYFAGQASHSQARWRMCALQQAHPKTTHPGRIAMNTKTKVLLGCALAASITAGLAMATPTMGAWYNVILSTGTSERDIHTQVHLALPGMDEDFSAVLVTEGASNIIQQEIKFSPGGTTGWHTHPGIVLLTLAADSGPVDWYDSRCGKTVYNAGDSWTEGTKLHDVVNRGSTDVHFLVTYIVAKDVNKRTDQAAPRCAAALGLM
jgi:quercetin dioxygenase-like cupin family protein